jgi:malonyl CoA-acyl carrier protein transacylase/phosphopantetheinyl transferase
MFPGEGSQYPGMFADLALHFDAVRTWFDFWRSIYNDPPGEGRTDIVFPPESELTDSRRAELEKRLHDMDVGSEAVFIGSQAMRALLKAMGVQPDVMVGHSTGESSALAASGAMDYNNFDQLAYFIKELNQVYQGVLGDGNIPTGVLMSVGALSQSTVEEHITALNDGIVIAMDNCSNQLVLFGEKTSIDALQSALITAGGICMPLPFDRGYHTPQFSSMSKVFLDYYKRIGLKKPRTPLYSCATADLFPADEDSVRKLAAGQWSTKVRFRETIAKMHRDGVRYFVEVGPSGNLSAFVNDILSGKEHLAVAMNLRRKNDVEQLLISLAHLYVNGKQVKLEKLFRSRSVKALELEKGLRDVQPHGMPLDNTMPVVHLDDTDRARLKEILLPPEPAVDKTRPASPELDTLFSANDASADDRVMSDYFSLMRGFLDQQRRVLEQAGMSSETVPEEAPALADPTPFLTSINALDEHHLEAACRLSVYEDNFLRDHILSGAVSDDAPDLLGLSCVPLMVSLEIMAEACAVLAGSTAVTVIENIEALAWIALDDGELTLTVRAEAIDGDYNKIRAHLINDGSVAVTADFCFGADWRASPLPALAEKRAFRWEARELYHIGMFHGPIFQSIDSVHGWSEQGIDAGLSNVALDGFFDGNTATALVLNPVLLDALGQLSAYWIAQQVGTDFNCFPSTIERIELYQPCPQNMAGLTLRARQQTLDPDDTNIAAPRAWQFECLDSQGQPLLSTTNLVNVYFPVPHAFYEVRRDPLNGWLGQPLKSRGHQNVTLWRLPHFSDEFCTQSGGIFLRILAQAVLSFEERERWRELKGNLRHRLKWLFGRICIKEAVRYWIFQQAETLLYPSDIVVLHDELGAPYVDGWWNEEIVQAPEVSLSHNVQLSLAAVSSPHYPVGIDTENIGRFKSTDLIEGSLAACERTLLRGVAGHELSEKVLRMWCAKEAAAKYLGTGLKGTPEKFEVSFLDDDWKRAHVKHDKYVIEVALGFENNSIIALASAPSD